jgi:hypothetical protein
LANPTGSTYLQANQSYTWMEGDVYEIPQTDTLEGAATGASFSGLGVVNQPHQLLLNKIDYTHVKQLTDETNISALQTFAALFASSVGPSGYLKLGAQDVSKGQIDIIVQWGTISLIGQSFSALINSTPLNFNFPIAFPNAVWVLYPVVNLNAKYAINDIGIPVVVEPVTPLQLQGNSINFNSSTGEADSQFFSFAQTPTDGKGITGVSWLAIGY